MHTVLIANRGEIAIRVIRACKDAGLKSVAVYADPDRDALHVRLADQAFALGGSTAAESYLVIDKILNAARESGADAIHPGYGFLSENADFAQAVIDAGLTWIGPPPAAIRSLGDKVSARHIAQRAGAPQVPGTADPVTGADEVVAFAQEHGLPVAIKAAFGGGGRGLKVARSLDEIPDLYDSAVREAVAAFGRGECFVERYLDNPRHVETQVLADMHGNVVVVSTRDCSLQRRHQKLVEEAPAPFLTDDQLPGSTRPRRRSSRRPATTTPAPASSSSAPTARSRSSRSTPACRSSTPSPRRWPGSTSSASSSASPRAAPSTTRTRSCAATRSSSASTARIPGRNFLPAPGVLSVWKPPSGPGVRVDSGFEAGDVIGGNFDSLLAKLIVTGATREEALERSRRALDEFEVEGIATAITFHRVVVRDPAFAPAPGVDFSVHTRWIETEFDNTIPAYTGASDALVEPEARETVVVEVGGKRVEVTLPAGLGASAGAPAGAAPKKRKAGKKAGSGATGDSLVAPMQGTIVKVEVAEGQEVAEGDLIVVLEAMKMEQPLTAHKAGTIEKLTAEVGSTVPTGTVLCEIKG